MNKKGVLISLFLLIVCLLFSLFELNKVKASEEVQYDYHITASSSSLKDLVRLYEVKEELVINYDNCINKELSVLDNYNSFSSEEIVLKGNVFYIVIGEGKGISLEGKLRINRCDNTTLNNRFALLEWLSKA